jgi:hypothetical protein
MSQTRDVLVMILDEIAKGIKRLSEQEFDELVSGKAKFRFNIERSTRSDLSKKGLGKRKEHRQMTAVQGRELVDRLRALEVREEGYKLIADVCARRDDLAQVARVLDLPTNKRDPIERLQDKIIEATIGYRLRSRAIQGGDDQMSGIVTGSPIKGQDE